MLKANGFDKAVIGFDVTTHRIIYNADKMVDILMKQDGMSEEEALEYLEFNTFGNYQGEYTPIYYKPVKNMKELEDVYFDIQ